MQKKEIAGDRHMSAAAAGKNRLFAGRAPAVFRSATHAWKRISGVLPVAGLTGSVRIAGP